MITRLSDLHYRVVVNSVLYSLCQFDLQFNFTLDTVISEDGSPLPQQKPENTVLGGCAVLYLTAPVDLQMIML